MHNTHGFTLTFTQCKQLADNGVDLRDFIEELNNQPAFLDFMGNIESISQIQAILQGGCESGAYMPAVTYHKAQQCMGECGDDVLDYLESRGYDIPTPEGLSWSGYCSVLCSMAVEAWCQHFSDNLDGVDWEQLLCLD